MPQIEGRARLELRVVLSLSEDEAGALDALFGYDVDEFLKVFYSNLGKAYLEPHERGLRALHESRGQIKSLIEKAAEARKVFSK